MTNVKGQWYDGELYHAVILFEAFPKTKIFMASTLCGIDCGANQNIEHSRIDVNCFACQRHIEEYEQ